MNRNRVSAHINSMSAWRREHAAHAIRVQDFHPPHWTEQLAKPFPAGKTKEKGIKVLSSDGPSSGSNRSEEHTSELQSPDHLVCRLLLEKKKRTAATTTNDLRAFIPTRQTTNTN